MNIALYIFAGLAGCAGFLAMVASKSSIHEIYAAIWFLIAAVLAGSAAVVTAVDSLKSKIAVPHPKKIIAPQQPDSSANPITRLEDDPENSKRGNVQCNACGLKMPYPKRLGGKEVQCHSCGQSFQLPYEV